MFKKILFRIRIALIKLKITDILIVFFFYCESKKFRLAAFVGNTF